jgi:hypothetical protein
MAFCAVSMSYKGYEKIRNNCPAAIRDTATPRSTGSFCPGGTRAARSWVGAASSSVEDLVEVPRGRGEV